MTTDWIQFAYRKMSVGIGRSAIIKQQPLAEWAEIFDVAYKIGFARLVCEKITKFSDVSDAL